MFVTCHINFWPLSNFVGASLEVTRTISNNKLHFTWGCSILLLKKKEKGPATGFLWWFWHIFKYFNSNLFSNCFSCLFYLGVHRGTGVFFVLLFFTPPLARDSLSRSPCACLRLTENAEKSRLFDRSRPPQWN